MHRIPLQSGCLLIALALCASSFGCVTNPASGGRELRLMSQASEIRLGERYYQETLASFGGDLHSDAQASAYVSEVGHKVAAQSERPDLPYEFSVINSSDPHAWALPGGKIGVTRGLLAELESEAELAAVLAHQVAHLSFRDAAKAVELDVIKDVAITTVAIGATFFGVPVIAAVPLLMRSGSTGEWLTKRSHSDTDEIEADRAALQYLKQAGYRVESATDLLTRLATGDIASDAGLLHSHPISRKRLANAHMGVYRAGERDEAAGEENRERFEREMALVQRIQTAYDDYDAAVDAYEIGDYDAALALVHRAVEIVPDDARFYELEGDVLMATLRYEDALQSYDRSVAVDPSSAPAYMRRASARRALGDHGGAQQDFSTSYLLEPDDKVKRQMGSRLDRWEDDPFFHRHNFGGPGYHPTSSWPRRGD